MLLTLITCIYAYDFVLDVVIMLPSPSKYATLSANPAFSTLFFESIGSMGQRKPS